MSTDKNKEKITINKNSNDNQLEKKIEDYLEKSPSKIK